MFANPFIRIVAGIPFAAVIVVALFIIMGLLIEPKPIELGESEFRTLSRITPQEERTEIRRTQRTRVQRIQTSDAPPPPPRLSSSRSDVNLPTPQIQGAAPANVEIGNVSGFALDAVVVSDRDAQPIRPPVPSYPTRAAERGIEGNCDVRFDVDERGRPFNIEATCTDSVFVREAERAVSRVEFAPKIVRGQAVRRVNVVYPISFTLQ